MSTRRRELAARRRAHGMSQEQLATYLGVDRSSVGRWERGEVDPLPWVRPLLARALEISLDELDQLLAPFPTDHKADVSAAGSAAIITTYGSTDALVPTTRTSADQDAIFTAAYESTMFARRATATNIDATTLDQIHADIDRIARAYLTRPLGELIHIMRSVRDQVFACLGRRQHPKHTRQLYRSAAQLCGLMASASSDLGYYAAARAHAQTAAICADLAGDSSTMAWIAATLSLIEFWDDQPTKALYETRAGRVHAAGDSDLLRLFSLEARAAARLGDARTTREAINLMTNVMDRTNVADHRSIFDFPHANALRCAGSSFLWLNQFGEARQALSQALDGFEAHAGGGSYAHIAATRIDLSLAHLGERDFEAAYEALRPILNLSPQRLLSGTVRRFGHVRAALTQPPYKTDPAARDLSEHLTTLSYTAAE